MSTNHVFSLASFRYLGPRTGKRLFRKYAFLLMLLVIGLLFVSGIVAAVMSYHESKGILLRLQKEKAIAAATTIKRFIEDVEKQIAWTSHGAFLSGSEAIAQRQLDFIRLLRESDAISDIRLVDASGKERLHISRFEPDRSDTFTDFAGHSAFLESKAKKTYYSPLYFQKASEPYMTVAIVDPHPRESVTLAEVNLKFVWDEISRIHVSEGSYAYVVDAMGSLVTHSDIGLVLRRTNMLGLSQVRAAVAELADSAAKTRSIDVGQNLEGSRILTAHAQITPLNWIVFVETPLSEAFEPIYSLMKSTGILILIGIFFAIGGSIFLTRRITDPIGSLREGAIRIGAGELDHRINIRTGDELEDVGQQFNRMAGKLKESYAGLEREVAERTSELRTALAKIRSQSKALSNWNRELEARVLNQVEQLERMARLKRFLSPQVAQLVMDQGAERLLESHRGIVSILFFDLRGFTKFAEETDPEEVMTLLTSYHAVIGKRVHQYEGTVERFSGDGIMVFFNDPIPCPDHSERAVRMALDVLHDVALLRKNWLQQGFHLGCGVGIAMGPAILGKIGFEGRFDYGAAGAVVNLAARLCDAAKDQQILVSKEVMEAIKEIGLLEPIGNIPLKGLQRHGEVFNVTGLKTRQCI